MPHKSLAEKEPDKSLLRTVDCLQRFYALLLALATVEAFKKLISSHVTGEAAKDALPLNLDGDILFHVRLLPDFLTFVFTVAPFYHGMHRHLDAAYATLVPRKDRGSLGRYFFLDFVLSWLGYALLFALQMSMGKTVLFGVLFTITLGLNGVWALVIAPFGKGEHVFAWLVINWVSAFAAFAATESTASGDLTQERMHWLLTGLALARSVADYASNWEFYFPAEPEPQTAPRIGTGELQDSPE